MLIKINGSIISKIKIADYSSLAKFSISEYPDRHLLDSRHRLINKCRKRRDAHNAIPNTSHCTEARVGKIHSRRCFVALWAVGGACVASKDLSSLQRRRMSTASVWRSTEWHATLVPIGRQGPEGFWMPIRYSIIA